MNTQVSRYFERVLGIRAFASPRALVKASQVPAAHGVCLLIEVGSASTQQPSIQKMGARMVEALRSEWLKKSIDSLPEMQWLQASDDDWSTATKEASETAGSPLRLAIVCGAAGTLTQADASVASVLHVPSFLEMNSSPALKREAWMAIQAAIRQQP